MNKLFHEFCQSQLIYQGGRAHCGFEAWKLTDKRVALRFSEYPDNQGRSVTNAIEDLATFAAGRLNLRGETLVVCEHYLYSRARESETFDEVSFNWAAGIATNPVWTRRDEAWWLRMAAEGTRIPMEAVLAATEVRHAQQFRYLQLFASNRSRS